MQKILALLTLAVLVGSAKTKISQPGSADVYIPTLENNGSLILEGSITGFGYVPIGGMISVIPVSGSWVPPAAGEIKDGFMLAVGTNVITAAHVAAGCVFPAGTVLPDMSSRYPRGATSSGNSAVGSNSANLSMNPHPSTATDSATAHRHPLQAAVTSNAENAHTHTALFTKGPLKSFSIDNHKSLGSAVPPVTIYNTGSWHAHTVTGGVCFYPTEYSNNYTYYTTYSWPVAVTPWTATAVWTYSVAYYAAGSGTTAATYWGVAMQGGTDFVDISHSHTFQDLTPTHGDPYDVTSTTTTNTGHTHGVTNYVNNSAYESSHAHTLNPLSHTVSFSAPVDGSGTNEPASIEVVWVIRVK